MEAQDLVLVLVVVTAFAFDFTNGFHDTANAMATSIATKALKPMVAVGLAAPISDAPRPGPEARLQRQRSR